jgi:putative glycosyltransferase (TIGR04348 family)
VKISIVTPAGARMRNGNRHTALRWAALLRELGHTVKAITEWDGRPADVMIALHARRSHASISRYATAYPDRPLVVALTGTDVYRDIAFDANAQESLELASRMIVLQPMALKELPRRLRKKTHVVMQSTAPIRRRKPLESCFEVIVSGHLRDEKDPFRTAAALGYLPAESRIRVTHVGRAMSPAMEAEARRWMRREPRYRWLGEVTHARAVGLLARSRLMVISSKMEGGANVVTEALTARVPVLASRVSGNVGLLGGGYAGYFGCGDERELAALLSHTEKDRKFLQRLAQGCSKRRAQLTPAQEKTSLKQVLECCAE